MTRKHVQITGTMKFDTAHIADSVDGVDTLASGSGDFESGEEITIWVCGSTGPGEEEIILNEYCRLLDRYAFPPAAGALIPRHPERFDEARGRALGANGSSTSCADPRKTPGGCLQNTLKPPVILGDTMGELRKFYSLADVIFVGRTLVDLGEKQHGSDMIEPAALAKPVIVGPFTGNFADVMLKFRNAAPRCSK